MNFSLQRSRKTSAPVELDPMILPDSASYLAQHSIVEALKTPGVGAKISALALWWPTSRFARALGRYTMRDGDLQASGMALTVLVSLTAAMTVALTIFMAVLGSYTELRDNLIISINGTFPGLLETDTTAGLVDPDDFVTESAFTPASMIAFVVMTWTGIGVVGKLGRSIRSMFGVVIIPELYPKTLLRNLAGALGMLVSIVAASGMGLAVDLASPWLLGIAGLTDSQLSHWILTILSYAIPFIIHMWVSWVMIRIVAGIRVPRRDLRHGLLLMAGAATLLRVLGASVVASASGPLLATATTLITLVLWINIQMRVILFVSAWTANPPRAVPVTENIETRFTECPNYVTMSVPATLEWPHHTVTGELAPAPTPAVLPTDYAPYFGPTHGRTLKSWLFGPSELSR